MNYVIALLSCMSIGVLLAENQQVHIPIPASIHTLQFNVNNNNSHIISNTQTWSAPAQQIQEIPLPPTNNQVIVHQPPTFAQKALEYCSAHKVAFAGITLSCAACYCIIKAILLQRFLHNPHNWCNWCSHKPLTELVHVPGEQLAQALFNDIQQRYTSQNHTGSALDPLICFINNANHELAKLKTFHAWYQWIKPVFYIMPTTFAILDGHIDEKVQRLEFLKHLLVTWLREYKVHHAA